MAVGRPSKPNSGQTKRTTNPNAVFGWHLRPTFCISMARFSYLACDAGSCGSGGGPLRFTGKIRLLVGVNDYCFVAATLIDAVLSYFELFGKYNMKIVQADLSTVSLWLFCAVLSVGATLFAKRHGYFDDIYSMKRNLMMIRPKRMKCRSFCSLAHGCHA